MWSWKNDNMNVIRNVLPGLLVRAIVVVAPLSKSWRLCRKWIRVGHGALGNSSHNLSVQEDPFLLAKTVQLWSLLSWRLSRLFTRLHGEDALKPGAPILLDFVLSPRHLRTRLDTTRELIVGAPAVAGVYGEPDSHNVFKMLTILLNVGQFQSID